MNPTNNLTPWGAKEKEAWRIEQTVKRSYQDEVLAKLAGLSTSFEVIQYGTLSYDPDRYPLYFLQPTEVDPDKRTALITGGVHGYEISGVQGALRFMQTEAAAYAKQFNIICFPCISPWGYETINRWNPLTIDPNRSFYRNSPAEECDLFLEAIDSLDLKIDVHFDLHETTDTDNTVFRPALQQRDGKLEEPSEIPDGFYLVGDKHRPQPEFQKAIIDAVRKITHIAAADKDGRIIGKPVAQEGVVYYDKKKLFLCGGFSDAPYVTTTEVYPDSPRATDEICIQAQVAAIKGGLDHLETVGV